MRLTIVMEQVAGLGALAGVALLGQLDPAMQAAQNATQAGSTISVTQCWWKRCL